MQKSFFKKVFAILLVLVMSISLAACGDKKDGKEDETKADDTVEETTDETEGEKETEKTTEAQKEDEEKEPVEEADVSAEYAAVFERNGLEVEWFEPDYYGVDGVVSDSYVMEASADETPFGGDFGIFLYGVHHDSNGVVYGLTLILCCDLSEAEYEEYAEMSEAEITEYFEVLFGFEQTENSSMAAFFEGQALVLAQEFSNLNESEVFNELNDYLEYDVVEDVLTMDDIAREDLDGFIKA